MLPKKKKKERKLPWGNTNLVQESPEIQIKKKKNILNYNFLRTVDEAK